MDDGTQDQDEPVDETPCTVVGHISPQLIWDRLAGEGRGPLLNSRLSPAGPNAVVGEA